MYRIYWIWKILADSISLQNVLLDIFLQTTKLTKHDLYLFYFEIGTVAFLFEKYFLIFFFSKKYQLRKYFQWFFVILVL